MDYLHLYVEKFDEYERFLLLDFVSDEEFRTFTKQLDYPTPDQQNTASMLRFEQIPFNKNYYPKEGSVYRIPICVFKNFRMNYSYDYNNVDDSPVIRFTYTYNPEDTNQTERDQALKQLFHEEASAKQFVYKVQGNWAGPPCGAESLQQDIEVIVKQVGQGSWNIIRSLDKCKVVFDIGCSIYYSINECMTLLGTAPFKDHPSLIISHWDIDHYSLLTVTSDADLNQICCAFVPEECISRTSKVVAKRLESNCRYLCAIKSISSRKVNRRVSLNVIYNDARYILFSGEQAKNKNLSGLALIIYNGRSCIFLSADHSYQQVFEDMENALYSAPTAVIQKCAVLGENYICHLVVPHHGGEAGKNDGKFSLGIPGKAIISTGKNSYGHPFNEVRKKICDMGFEWVRTDYSGDVRITL